MPRPAVKAKPLQFLRTIQKRDPLSGDHIIAHCYLSETILDRLIDRAASNRSRRCTSGPVKVKVYIGS